MAEKIIFLFKIFVSPSLDSSARGGSTNRPSLAAPLLCRPRLRYEDNIRIYLTEIGRRRELVISRSVWGQVAGSYDHEESLDEPSSYQLVKDSATECKVV